MKFGKDARYIAVGAVWNHNLHRSRSSYDGESPAFPDSRCSEWRQSKYKVAGTIALGLPSNRNVECAEGILYSALPSTFPSARGYDTLR